jgi:hypothetical protein
MRNQMLEMQGWQVVSIPFNTWAKLAGLQEKQASSSRGAGCRCRGRGA